MSQVNRDQNEAQDDFDSQLFYKTVNERAEEAAQALLDAFPSLNVVSINFGWKNQDEKAPMGVILPRNSRPGAEGLSMTQSLQVIDASITSVKYGALALAKICNDQGIQMKSMVDSMRSQTNPGTPLEPQPGKPQTMQADTQIEPPQEQAHRAAAEKPTETKKPPTLSHEQAEQLVQYLQQAMQQKP